MLCGGLVFAIVMDVAAYFVESEQIPTACALGVLVDRDQSVKVAGGYLIQLLPGAPEEIIDKLEAGIKRAGAVTPMLEAGMTPEDILGQVCGDLGVLFLFSGIMNLLAAHIFCKEEKKFSITAKFLFGDEYVNACPLHQSARYQKCH